MEIDTAAFNNFSDFFFNNIITDWILNQQVSSALGTSQQAKRTYALRLFNKPTSELQNVNGCARTDDPEPATQFAWLADNLDGALNLDVAVEARKCIGYCIGQTRYVLQDFDIVQPESNVQSNFLSNFIDASTT